MGYRRRRRTFHLRVLTTHCTVGRTSYTATKTIVKAGRIEREPFLSVDKTAKKYKVS